MTLNLRSAPSPLPPFLAAVCRFFVWQHQVRPRASPVKFSSKSTAPATEDRVDVQRNRAQGRAVTPRSKEFNAWYLDVIDAAELADCGPVRGTMVIRPYGYAIWEAIQDYSNVKFKETGHSNMYFPQIPGKQGKFFGISMELSILVDYAKDKLAEIQSSLLERATSFHDSEADEISLKEETGATIWCFPFEQPEEIKMCLMTGNPANEVAIFAKSY